jgi:hypothetical protein
MGRLDGKGFGTSPGAARRGRPSLIALAVGPDGVVECDGRVVRVRSARVLDALPGPSIDPLLLELLAVHPDWVWTLVWVHPLVIVGSGPRRPLTLVTGLESYEVAFALGRRLGRRITLPALLIPPRLAGDPDWMAALALLFGARRWFSLSRGALVNVVRMRFAGAPRACSLVTLTRLLGIRPQAAWAASRAERATTAVGTPSLAPEIPRRQSSRVRRDP